VSLENLKDNKMKNIIKFTFLSILITSCAKDKIKPVVVDCKNTISYINDLQPVLNLNCTVAGCHNSTDVAAGRVYETHANLASNPAEVLNSFTAVGTSAFMPQGGTQLKDSIIDKFRCWINQGKKNN
jgi:hypothetical protein